MRIGSITKTFMAALTLRLDDLGVLDIEDPVAAHLPDLGIDDTVTIRDLLGHTSGIADPDPAQIIALFREDSGQRFEFQDLISVADVPTNSRPHADEFAYANSDCHVLGGVIEAAAGTDVATTLRTHILEPASHTPHDSRLHRRGATTRTGVFVRDRIDVGGKITFRHHGRMFKIGVGRHLERTSVICLVKDLHIRIIDAATGEVLRTLELDTTRTYQPTGRPHGGPKGPRKPKHPNP